MKIKKPSHNQAKRSPEGQQTITGHGKRQTTDRIITSIILDNTM
jgi:predicted RNA binding protein YcfA (HicA-like mRNA interferase family)